MFVAATGCAMGSEWQPVYFLGKRICGQRARCAARNAKKISPPHCYPEGCLDTHRSTVNNLEGAGYVQCPLWVKSGHVQRTSSCLLYPRKRHQMRQGASAYA